jgi:hypothetical protein
MEKSIHFRVNEGTFMIIEANAKKNHQTVSDWLRHAVDEQIKRSVDSRLLDRVDERIYRIDKVVAELKGTLGQVKAIVENLESA